MTIAPERPLRVVEEPLLDDTDEIALTQQEAGGPREVSVRLVAVAAALSAGSAALVAGQLFHGGEATEIALTAAALAAAVVAVSYRMPRPALLQLGLVPALLALGAALTTEGGGSGRGLPRLVREAITSGGLREPPVVLAPGWRFLLVVLFGLLSAAAVAAAMTFSRPKLAVAVPLPVTIACSLLLPTSGRLVVTALAVVLVVVATAVAFGADLAADGIGGADFELRRLARGAVLLVLVVAALVGVSRTDALFPRTTSNQVVPPRKPPVPTPQPDRVLFSVRSTLPGPWRLGTLDVYGDNAFLLPPQDPRRLRDAPSPTPPGPHIDVEFTVGDLSGQFLPGPASPLALRGLHRKVTYDPRTELFRLADSTAPRGLRYTVETPAVPTGKELAASPAPPPALLAEFTQMPPAPSAVTALLSRAPKNDPFDRLQFVRQALYLKVVAAGSGKPVDVPTSRVPEMLAGGQATPYEITAAEVMLARWAGIPARIGYGFYGGEAHGGVTDFRPRHGAAWLEAYFQGHDWVPIVGTPPRAKPSDSTAEKRHDSRIRASDQLALTVYVPVADPTIQQLYQVVRYYLKTYVPLVLALVALAFSFPAALKALRRRRRRRWARTGPPVRRLLVAYAEMRDAVRDLGVGLPSDSPLELYDRIAVDEEHEELAWLVTRALWGDLRRDLREHDVLAAEHMARSVVRRLRREQTTTNRLLARVSRASLTEPWTLSVPGAPRVRARLRPASRRKVAAAAAVGLLASGCLGPSGSRALAPSAYLPDIGPSVAGLAVVRQQGAEAAYRHASSALVTEGRVYTLRAADGTIEGSFQTSLFKTRVNGQDRGVERGIEKGLGSLASFRTEHLGVIRLRVLRLEEQTLVLWFPPGRNVMDLVVTRKAYAGTDRLVAEVAAHQLGYQAAPEGGG